MAIIENIITPIFTFVVMLAFILWVLYLVFKGLQFFFEDLGFWIKYKVLRRDYDESIIYWCMDMIRKKKSQDELRKILLLEGRKPKEIKEILYIWRNIIQLKGGLKHDK